jgi:hypothetical protein
MKLIKEQKMEKTLFLETKQDDAHQQLPIKPHKIL